MFLVGDIGGTKTRLALYLDKNTPLREEKFESKHYPSLLPLIEEFLSKEKNIKIKGLCLGIAGVVEQGICHTTNLPWEVDIFHLGRVLKIDKVALLNDLEANAWGIPLLKEEEFLILNKGKPKRGNAALISAGTGLGEAGLFWKDKSYIPFATEGGHTDFAPRNEEEIQLLLFLRDIFPHVSYERILSGSGVILLYRFLVERMKKKPNPKIEALKKNEEAAALITEEAIEGNCPTCKCVISTFNSIYGAESGNLALKLMATSGLYIGGGIAPKIFPYFSSKEFMDAFVNKGRFCALLEAVPVKVILNDKAALLGALNYAQTHTLT